MQQTTRASQRQRASKKAPVPRHPARPIASGAAEPLRPARALFDRYRLQRELGRGGVADVWAAHDDRLDRSVAIKVLRPELLPDAGWRRRFVAEARSASGLSHPGIVPVYDVIDDPATPAIVFQLVEGESLAERLARDGSVPVDAATRIAGQVAAALDHAHRAGLVHRDVKPANIVIDGDGRARLVDFGIARFVEEASAASEGREVIGTLQYMAPEQLAGRPADARTDLYALGLVISEMVPDLEAAPGWLRELVDRLRASDPADRPASAADVARALETGRLDGADTAARAELVDPDAVTRSYGAAPIRQPDEPAPIVEPSTPAAALVAFEPAPVAQAAPIHARPVPSPPTRRAPTDHRPIVAAALVTGLLLAGFAIGRGDLFNPASGDSNAARPAATQPLPAESPASLPTPKPHKPHGHGNGGD